MKQEILKNTIDMHIHSAPDIRERAMNDLQLAKAADVAKMKAIVLKSHLFPTTERAWILNQLSFRVKVFGGIVLNNSIGGLNPYAVENSIKLGAKIVWLPTTSAQNHQLKINNINSGINVLEGKRINNNLKSILKMVAAENVVLATGHISIKEIFKVVEEATYLGVQKIVITHPEFGAINMNIEDQKRLLNNYNNVFFERVYAQPIGGGMYKKNFKVNLNAINELGVDSTIISTDSGQIENPVWNIALDEYISYLKNNSITCEQIKRMTKYNPEYLLNI